MSESTIIKKTEHPAFKLAKQLILTNLGPFTGNPKIDELYVELRLLGMTEEQVKEFIYENVIL